MSKTSVQLKARQIKAGDVYGSMTVLDVPVELRRQPYVKVQCACGTERNVYRSRLVDGTVRNCGCGAQDASVNYDAMKHFWNQHKESV